VDSNQNHLGHIQKSGENYGLTSMLKQVDVAVYLTIRDLINGKFTAGVRSFGLKDTVEVDGTVYHGVYYAMDEYNKDLISAEMIKKVTEAEKKIIAGEIKVPQK
jgi:basic membrane protein A